MEKYILHPATFKLDGGAMFGIIPKPLWEKKIKADELNRILMSLRVILIDTGDRKILIDTGIGDYHSEKFNHQFDIQGKKDPLVNLMQKNLDLNPEEITDIIITHLHFDHVGGLGGENHQINFPNAKVYVHKKHYEYALHPTVRDAGSFQDHFFKPLLDAYVKNNQLQFIDGEEGEILPGVKFKVSFGHTPYMVHPIFDGFIYMADLVPMSHHLSIPWVMGYDIEPGVTTIYKEKFYQYILENNLTMIFEHDMDTWGAKITKDESERYIFSDVFKAQATEVQKI